MHRANSWEPVIQQASWFLREKFLETETKGFVLIGVSPVLTWEICITQDLNLLKDPSDDTSFIMPGALIILPQTTCAWILWAISLKSTGWSDLQTAEVSTEEKSHASNPARGFKQREGRHMLSRVVLAMGHLNFNILVFMRMGKKIKIINKTQMWIFKRKNLTHGENTGGIQILREHNSKCRETHTRWQRIWF